MRKMPQDFRGPTAVHFQNTDPGIRWEKDPWIAVDLGDDLDSESILTPNVIRLKNGGYRMYYTGRGAGCLERGVHGYIVSARSDDAVSWRKDPGIRVNVFPPHAAIRTLCPDVIPLADGGFRMYFEARSEGRPTVILSAVSEDGLDWRPDPGVRFEGEGWSYGSPRCVYLNSPEGESAGPKAGYRLYFHRTHYPPRPEPFAGNVIISAVSSDGLRFTEEEGVRISQETDRESSSVYAPEVILLADGTYRMYYAAWNVTIRGGVLSATSPDGLFWTKDRTVLLDLGTGTDPDSNMVSEPCVIDLDDGRFRMFYEAKDSRGRARILSATSVNQTG